jgi:methionyl aminopeptidase
MAIVIKSGREIELMRRAGRVVAEALDLVGRLVKPGITTESIDRAVGDLILSRDCEIAFKGLYGFPANSCISVNEQVVHGIPGGRRLEEGDIVSVDIGTRHKNYHGDGARTFPVGQVSEEDEKLMRVCRESLERGIGVVRAGIPLSEVSAAIQRHVEGNGFSVVRKYVGHGIGIEFHEEPQIPNFVERGRGRGVVLRAGMVLAIEPMVNAGTADVRRLSDGWTVVTADGGKSAHFENSVLVTEDGTEVLTRLD